MKHKVRLLSVLLLASTLALTMLLATTATAQTSAQTTDLCGLPLRGAIGGIDATATPNYGSYPSTYYSGNYGGVNGMYDEEQYYTPQPTPTATPVPQPINPANKSCEFGKILIAVTTTRHGTYRIGDTIVVDIYISTDPTVQLNFDNLIQQNALVFGTSDFELIPPPVLTSSQEDGRNQYHLQLRVRSFSTKPIQFVTVDLLYAVEFAESNAPAWRRLTSPELMITTTSTLDHGEQPLQGDIQQRPVGRVWLANVLLGVGAIVIVATLLVFGIPRTIKYLTRPRPVGANVIAWQQFDEILARGKTQGFVRADYAQIAAALRAFIAREPATLREITIVNKGDERLAYIRNALRKLDAIVFAPVGEEKLLNIKELEQLERELSRIVPRGE